MMQYDTNTDVIPPATQFLLSEANKISPVTPEGTPTVASQVLQAAGAMPPMQPQMGMPQVGRMAGLGAQVGATQQQQEQNKIMEMLKQMAQRNNSMNFGVMAAPGAQQFKPPGMAGGGIVGYAGDEGSDVRYPGLMQYETGGGFGGGVPGARGAGTLLPETTGYEGMDAWDALKKMYEDLIAKVPKGSLAEKQLRNLQEEEGKERMRGYKPRRTPETLAMEEGILAGRQAAPKAPPAPPEEGVAPKSVPRPQAAPSAGIAQLVGPPRPDILQRREAQLGGIFGQMQAPTVKTMRQEADEYAAMRKEYGLPEDPEAAARQRLDALRAEAEAEQKRRATTPEGEMWNRLIAGLAGAAGKSNIGYMGAGIAAGTQNAAEAIEAEKQRNFKLFRDFKTAEAKELDLLEKAKEQRIMGFKDKADKSAEAARVFGNDKLKIQAQATIDFGKLEAEEAIKREEIAGRDRVARINAAADMARTKAIQEGNADNKLIGSINGAQANLNRAIKEHDDKIKGSMIYKMMQLPNFNPQDPKYAEAIKSFNKARQADYNTNVLPLVNHLNTLLEKTGMAPPKATSPSGKSPQEMSDDEISKALGLQ